MASRTAFVIAYHYPPIRSAGVERTVKFERYLPEFGYRTNVLTTTAFGGVSDGRVRRAWEPLGLYRHLFNRAARTDRQAASGVRTGRSRAGDGRRGRRGFGLARRWLLIPDGQILWLPAALAKGLRYLRREQADLIYSTSPPASAHLVALLLAQLTGLPWVADFRDSWVYDPLDPALLEMPYRNELERRFEEAVVRRADAILAATRISADHLRRSYADAADRIHVITNGFDPEDVEMALTRPAPESLLFDPEGHDEYAASGLPVEPSIDAEEGVDRPLRVVHTGSFSVSHPERTPMDLFAALRSLLEEDAEWARRLEVVLVGRLDLAEVRQAADLVQAGILSLHDEVDRRTALSLQSRADVLLLVDHARPWPGSNVPGKLFDYLGVGRPIMALCGAGAVADLMTELDAGVSAAPDEPAAIRGALEEMHRRFRAGSLARDQTRDLSRFHRRELSRQLAACFDFVLSGRAGKRE